MRIKIHTPISLHSIGGRKNQEDSIYPSLGESSRDDRVFVVCDGMGGHEHGEVASSTVTRAIARWVGQNLDTTAVCTPDDITAAINSAYYDLEQYGSDDERRMGTTLTMLVLHRGGAIAAHIGDSRIYHIRPDEGRILYKSRDHSLVNELFYSGSISRLQLYNHPRRNVITRAMQPCDDNEHPRCKPSIALITDIKPGDFFLLCSDGVLENLRDYQLVEMLQQGGDLHAKLTHNTQGNKDNCSAYLIGIDTVTRETDDKHLIDNEQELCDVVIDQRDDFSKPDYYYRPEMTLSHSNRGEVAAPPPPAGKPKKAKPWWLLVALLVVAAVAAAIALTRSNVKEAAPQEASIAAESTAEGAMKNDETQAEDISRAATATDAEQRGATEATQNRAKNTEQTQKATAKGDTTATAAKQAPANGEESKTADNEKGATDGKTDKAEKTDKTEQPDKPQGTQVPQAPKAPQAQEAPKHP